MARYSEALESLQKMPATDVKQRGWRGVVMTVRERGAVLVTNHNQPEAVIITAADYAALVERAAQAGAGKEAALEKLRREFDERLAALNASDAGERLRSTMRGPIRLHGKVKAGTGF
jgi:prevent-host-death family protein